MIGLAVIPSAPRRCASSTRWRLAILNEALYRESAQEVFCTAVYVAIGVADDQMEVELTCAGHPLPLVLRRTASRRGTPGHAARGGPAAWSSSRAGCSLDPGDALVMFTDGVLEARSEEGVFGEDRLRRPAEHASCAPRRRT